MEVTTVPRETALIVGASLAGGRAAETLRQEGFEPSGRICLERRLDPTRELE